MTNILSAENVYKSYGEKVLVDNASFGIDDGDRIGLIGVNGTGKSTLLKMAAGIEPLESGTLTLNGRATVHYLPQEPEFAEGMSVIDAVFQGDSEEMILLRQYEQTLQKLERRPEETPLQQQLLRLQTKLDNLDAWRLDYEAKAILSRLGIADFQSNVSKLSGGQRKRVALARALIQPSSLLILDEPTNHIDDENAVWLENYLLQRKGALLIVTHDRYFLDRVVNRIFELDRGALYQYPGNYNTFLERKLNRETSQRASEEKRQNFLRNELEWIQRGPRARGTKQKARTEQYYEVLEQTPDAAQETVELSSASTRLGKTVIELDKVAKGYDGTVLIKDFSYILLRNDRIGIIGPNGMGKSTLLKLMATRLEPDSGTVIIGTTVKIGYFSQDHSELPPDMRAIDFIRDEAEFVETAEGETITAAQMMERFLFPGPLQYTPIEKLSGGEKRRLTLLRILMSAPNVLLLDEPTNDLDIPTLSVLESYLDNFSGPVVAVSHDRYFLDKVSNKIFAFEDKDAAGSAVITKHVGNFSDYMARKQAQPGAGLSLTSNTSGTKQEAGTEAKDRAGVRARSEPGLNDGARESGDGFGAASAGPNETSTPGAGSKQRKARLHGDRDKPKLSFKEQKEYEGIEDRIAEVERSLEKLADEMNDAGSNHGKLQELYNQQQELEQQLDDLLERWAYLNEIVEAMEK